MGRRGALTGAGAGAGGTAGGPGWVVICAGAGFARAVHGVGGGGRLVKGGAEAAFRPALAKVRRKDCRCRSGSIGRSAWRGCRKRYGSQGERQRYTRTLKDIQSGRKDTRSSPASQTPRRLSVSLATDLNVAQRRLGAKLLPPGGVVLQSSRRPRPLSATPHEPVRAPSSWDAGSRWSPEAEEDPRRPMIGGSQSWKHNVRDGQ